MPTYEYKCTKCGHIFEKQQKMSDEPAKKCPECKGKVNKIFSAAGIVFKGSGFHNTDYGTGTSKPTEKGTKKKEPGSVTHKKDTPSAKPASDAK